MSTQLRRCSLSSSRPSFSTGPLISSLPCPATPFFLRLEAALLLVRNRKLSMRFKKLFALERVLLSAPLLIKLGFTSNAKVLRSRGDGSPSDRESSLAPDVPEEQTLATELALVVVAVLALEMVVAGLDGTVVLRDPPRPPLPALCREPTSGCSLRSVKTLSALALTPFFRRVPLEKWSSGDRKGVKEPVSPAGGENTSRSSWSRRDQRLLSLWKVQRPLIAHGSSSSESSL